MIIHRGLQEGRFVIENFDRLQVRALLDELEQSLQGISSQLEFMQSTWYLGHIYRLLGDAQEQCRNNGVAVEFWKWALRHWQTAIERAVERRQPFSLTLPRKYRLLREQIEIHYRSLLKQIRHESGEPSSEAVSLRDRAAEQFDSKEFQQAV